MKRFLIVAEVVHFKTGNVYLTGFQYQPRAEYLERVSPGLGKFGEYKILKPIEFIKGEIIGYTGESVDGIKELVKKEGEKKAEELETKGEEETKGGGKEECKIVDYDSLTKEEIITALKKLNMDFNNRDKKNILLELLKRNK